MLSDEQIERYSRQIILPQVGGKGQEKLLRAKVLVHASGALHAATLHYLAAAGVGTLGVFADVHDPILSALAFPHHTDSGDVLTRLNPDCVAVIHQPEERRAPQSLVECYDVVIADSAELHDACLQACRPFVYASFGDDEAWLAIFRGYEIGNPCLYCEPQALPAKATASTLSSIAALFVGAQLATETVKHLLGMLRSPATQRLCFRFLPFQCEMEILSKSSHCLTCEATVGSSMLPGPA